MANNYRSFKILFSYICAIMLEVFQKHLSFLDGAAADKKFLLAVSGGLDSIVMLELFRLSGYSYSIAHCNFKLRGKESDEDERFVKKLATKTKVPCFSVKFKTEEYCMGNKISIQMGARNLRYRWLEETRLKNKLDYVVTAHHADDAIETFFINLFRGTGISGLHGIAGKNGKVIRPMLPFYRKEIENFGTENKLEWREDSSNSTDKYERNKIRHHLMPVLEEVNSKAKESIITTIENLGRTELMLNKLLETFVSKYIRINNNRTFIGLDFFKDLVPASDFLFEVIRKFGFNYIQCKQIVERVKGQPGKAFISETHKLAIDRKYLIIESLVVEKELEKVEIGKDLKELVTSTHAFKFSRQKNNKSFAIPKTNDTAALDFDKLSFPVVIRKWEKGDRFYPLGMNKPKKLSDFLIDNKVSMPDKAGVNVLVSGGNIVWVAGYRLDERFKVTEATKNVYLCKLKNTIIL
jgi:tRNA(Ile)-lysidine synthase